MKTLVLGVKQGYVLSFNKIRFGKVNKQNIMKQPGVGHDFEQCSVNFGVGVGKILATPTPTQGKTSDSDSDSAALGLRSKLFSLDDLVWRFKTSQRSFYELITN